MILNNYLDFVFWISKYFKLKIFMFSNSMYRNFNLFVKIKLLIKRNNFYILIVLDIINMFKKLDQYIYS